MSKLASKRRVGLRSVFTAAVLLGGALPAAGGDWLFPPFNTTDFYDIGASWSTGTAPGAGDAANFLGANTGNIAWDNLVGNTTSASILVDTASITFNNVTGVSPLLTHTTVGNVVVSSGGSMTAGHVVGNAMSLNVGNTLDIQDTSQFNARFGSQVWVGGELFVGDTNGQSASATFDGSGTMLTLTGAASLGFAGSTGTLSFTNGATGNLLNDVSVADDITANTAGVLNVTGGSVVTAADIDAGSFVAAGVSGTILVDGSGSRITQAGSSTFDLGAGSLSTGLLTLSNGGRFDTGTGTTTINATGTLDISSNGRFVGRTVDLQGTANINGGLLFADQIQLNGGTLNTDASSVVAINTMTGFGNSVVLNGFVSFGEPAGPTAASHTVSAGQSFDVGQILNIGVIRQATFTIDGGDVTADRATIAVSAGAAGSTMEVINGGSLTVQNNFDVGGSSFGVGGAGTLDITGLGSSASVGGTLRIFSTGTVNLNTNATLRATHIDHTNGGAFNFTGGTLSVGTFNGNLNNNGGTLAPGNTPGDADTLGTTTVNGDYTQASASSTIALEFTNNQTPGTTYDSVDVNGHFSMAGTLDFDPLVPATLTVGDHFDLLDWDSRSGTFDQIELFDLGLAHFAWNTEDLYTTGEISFELAGDLNTDGFVGAADLDILLAHWGETTHQHNFAGGDVSGDGIVGTSDLQIVLDNWGTGTAPGGVVPEPGTCAILGMGAIALFKRRRRRDVSF